MDAYLNENLIPLNFSSLLLMRDISSTIGPTIVAVRNASAHASGTAYEWRFILPPYFVIFFLSISGNCMVIATLASNRRMRTVTNVYLMNLQQACHLFCLIWITGPIGWFAWWVLMTKGFSIDTWPILNGPVIVTLFLLQAVSDFLLGVFCLPFTLVGQIYRKFMFGSIMCKLIPFLQAVSVSVDVWTLVAISLERYFAICRPLKSRRWQTQCHAYKMLAIVWLFSLMLNMPILYASSLQPMKGNNYKCREVWSSLEMERTFNLGLDAALLLVPFFIMSFAYSLIVTKLWRGMRHEIQHNYNWQNQLSNAPSCKSCRTAHIIPALPDTTIIRESSDLFCKNNGNLWLTKKLPKGEEQTQLEPETLSTQSCCIHNLELDFRHAVRSTHIDKSIEAKRKVIRMLFVIILEFFICWAPLHVINTVYLFYPEELYKYIGAKGIISLQLLAYCSSCCNPITYCFMNRKFRLAFIGLFRSCKFFGCFFSVKSDGGKQATPQPSSADMTACVVRGSHTGRTELEGLEGEECV